MRYPRLVMESVKKYGVRSAVKKLLGKVLASNEVTWKVVQYARNREYHLLTRSTDLTKSPDTRLAVILHLYYPELWPTISRRLEHLDTPFDLFVSVQQIHKETYFPRINEFHKTTSVVPVPNRGRDVLPFLFIARMLNEHAQYDYVLKLHSKKSPHRTDGNDWLSSLLDELIPEDTSKIIDVLKDSDTGAVGPACHVVSLSRYMGENKKRLQAIVRSITSEDVSEKMFSSPGRFPFFGGTMFWCRMDYLIPLLESNLAAADFNSEDGQIDGTTAHAIERLLGRMLHEVTQKRMYLVEEAIVYELPDRQYTAAYKYV